MHTVYKYEKNDKGEFIKKIKKKDNKDIVEYAVQRDDITKFKLEEIRIEEDSKSKDIIGIYKIMRKVLSC